MLLQLWEKIVGNVPQYFTIGSSNSPQWHYGELLEYAMVSIAAILCIALVFRFLFMIVGLFGHKH